MRDQRFPVIARPFLVVGIITLVLACGSEEVPTETRSVRSKPAAPVFDFTTDYVKGLFEPSEHPAFIEIDTIYADRPGLFLRRDVFHGFLRLDSLAKTKGISLVIRSATRNFEYQKGIWERKWNGQTAIESGKDASQAYPDPVDRARAILRYSSMPGTSRHHWGTDIDLNAFENSWFEQGEGLAIYEFLTTYGAEYGFCQPYTPKGELRPKGYEEEKWHWTYFPVSSHLTELAEKSLKDNMIAGFQGAEAAEALDVVQNYVLGINQDCR